MPEYTIKSIMATGKVEKRYGSAEYYVQFDEMAEAVPLYFKDAPEVGQKIDLEQVKGQWKKVKKEWKPTADGGAVNAAKKQWTPMKKDNSDGQRQGMCLNNAANYVNTLEFKQALTNREWAELVHSYATSLYVLGELKTAEITPETVAGVFGGS